MDKAIDIDAGKSLRRLDVKVRIRGMRTATVRVKLMIWLFRLAVYVGGLGNLEVVIPLEQDCE